MVKLEEKPINAGAVKKIITTARRYNIQLKRFLKRGTKEYYSNTMEGGVYSLIDSEEKIAIQKEIKKITLTIQEYDKFRKIK